ncbi:MAG: hypothetical protein U1F50_13740 [Rubrivivax sp.]
MSLQQAQSAMSCASPAFELAEARVGYLDAGVQRLHRGEHLFARVRLLARRQRAAHAEDHLAFGHLHAVGGQRDHGPIAQHAALEHGAGERAAHRDVLLPGHAGGGDLPAGDAVDDDAGPQRLRRTPFGGGGGAAGFRQRFQVAPFLPVEGEQARGRKRRVRRCLRVRQDGVLLLAMAARRGMRHARGLVKSQRAR